MAGSQGDQISPGNFVWTAQSAPGNPAQDCAENPLQFLLSQSLIGVNAVSNPA